MSNDSKSAAAQEAVAWFTDDHLTDRSATTYDAAVAERWRAKGWPVTPLYAAPVAAAPVDGPYQRIKGLQGIGDAADYLARYPGDDYAQRRVAERLAQFAALHGISTPAAPGIDPADPWRGLYAPELMPKLDGVKVWHAAHPDLPEWPDEEERSIGPLIVAQGFAFAVVSGEYPDDDYAADEPDACAWLASWRPEPPAGDHWRLVMIQDTEDGPAAVYVRPLALIDASPKGDALQDDRFPGGFADAIAYADEMEEGAGRLYEQVIGFEDGSHTGTDMLAAVLRELQSSPKGGSDVKSRFDFCVKHSTFPVRTQDGRHWIMFVATDPAYPNRRSAFPAATPEASIDAAMQATSAEVGECNCPNGRAECMPDCASRKPTSHGAGVSGE